MVRMLGDDDAVVVVVGNNVNLGLVTRFLSPRYRCTGNWVPPLPVGSWLSMGSVDGFGDRSRGIAGNWSRLLGNSCRNWFRPLYRTGSCVDRVHTFLCPSSSF